MQLPQSTYREFGCTCCLIMGFGVDEKNPTEWSERILIQDDECVMHGRIMSNGRVSKTKSRAV